MNDIVKDQQWDFLERPKVEALDATLGVPRPVLDKGFIRVVDYMGDDSAIVQAARVSYGKGTKSPSDDRGLIRYLMKHWHTTPFEMCEIKLHVKLPVFVARQWIRHRTANVNEYSARYSILDKEFYLPGLAEMQSQSLTNKQGRQETLPEGTAREFRNKMAVHADFSYDLYEDLLREDSDEPGLAREISRMVLPPNIYTQWYWKVDLHNLLHFLQLRADPHAQKEIQVYAHVIAEIVKLWVPHAFQAWQDYRFFAETFSRQEMEMLRRVGINRSWMGMEKPDGMSDREYHAFFDKLGFS
ncbi:MAG: FAD-dependent thymidylate synthase [Cyanobacteria bacterium J06638_20]